MEDRLFRVSAQQPLLLPWIGSWNKLLASDLHIVMTGVQYSHGDWFNRFKLEDRWLTVPVRKGSTSQLIRDVRLAEGYELALKKMATNIRRVCMGRSAPYGDRLGPIVDVLERCQGDFLVDLSVVLFMALRDILGIKTVVRTDDDPREGMDRLEKLDCLLRDHVNQPFNYLSGAGARSYMGHDDLKSPVDTWFQEVDGQVSRDTILQLIACYERPLDAIAGCARWTDRNGQSSRL